MISDFIDIYKSRGGMLKGFMAGFIPYMVAFDLNNYVVDESQQS